MGRQPLLHLLVVSLIPSRIDLYLVQDLRQRPLKTVDVLVSKVGLDFRPHFVRLEVFQRHLHETVQHNHVGRHKLVQTGVVVSEEQPEHVTGRNVARQRLAQEMSVHHRNASVYQTLQQS